MHVSCMYHACMYHACMHHVCIMIMYHVCIMYVSTIMYESCVMYVCIMHAWGCRAVFTQASSKLARLLQLAASLAGKVSQC